MDDPLAYVTDPNLGSPVGSQATLSATLFARASDLHGLSHWYQVRRNGARLAMATPGADPVVVHYFACWHDTQRKDDDHDPGHGWRAAHRVWELWRTGRLLGPVLSDTQIALLVHAIATHNGAPPTTDPTIGCCYDADRLDLTRVGVAPDPALLSTTAAREIAATLTP